MFAYFKINATPNSKTTIHNTSIMPFMISPPIIKLAHIPIARPKTVPVAKRIILLLRQCPISCARKSAIAGKGKIDEAIISENRFIELILALSKNTATIPAHIPRHLAQILRFFMANV